MVGVSGEPLLDGVPLQALFEKARKLYDASAEREGEAAGQAMGECLALLEECSKRIRGMMLFSPNEDLDDVATSNLKYLLVPYMRADVAHRSPVLEASDGETTSRANSDEGARNGSAGIDRLPYKALSPEEQAEIRLKSLKYVLQNVEDFLGACDRLQLVSNEDRKALMGTLDPSAEVTDAATKRAMKIARFKKEKELKQKLEVIRARQAAAQRIRLRRGAVGGRSKDLSENGTEDKHELAEEDSAVDETEERQLWLLELQSSWIKALELQQVVKREEEMLAAARKASAGAGLASVAAKPLTREQLDRNLQDREASHRRAAAMAAAQLQGEVHQGVPGAQAITCAALAQDVIEGKVGQDAVAAHKHTPLPNIAFGPVSLMGGAAPTMLNGNLGSMSALSARQAAAARVFQPSHSLPTMSIEEAGLREMKMMNDFQAQVRREMEDQGFTVKENDSAMGTGNRYTGVEVNDDEDEQEEDESDAAVMKARKWDDWKDENPFGAGNSKRTPCG